MLSNLHVLSLFSSNYTHQGYEKIRAPKELFDLVHDFWVKNKDLASVEYDNINVHHNTWGEPSTILNINVDTVPGGGPALQSEIYNIARPLMEEWTRQELRSVSLYGIRLYHNGAILAPHVDRMPLVTSAISKCHAFLFCGKMIKMNNN
jgi:prolyl 4-hydroxylase